MRHVFPEQTEESSPGLMLSDKCLCLQGRLLSAFNLPQGPPPLVLKHRLRADSNSDAFTLCLLNLQSSTDIFYTSAKLLSEFHLLLLCEKTFY